MGKTDATLTLSDCCVSLCASNAIVRLPFLLTLTCRGVWCNEDEEEEEDARGENDVPVDGEAAEDEDEEEEELEGNACTIGLRLSPLSLFCLSLSSPLSCCDCGCLPLRFKLEGREDTLRKETKQRTRFSQMVHSLVHSFTLSLFHENGHKPSNRNRIPFGLRSVRGLRGERL